MLRRPAKIGGIRYRPGIAVEVSDAVHAQLVKQGVVEGMPSPSPPSVVRIPRSPEEKRAALSEAQERIAKVTGVPVPDAETEAEASPGE